ncbi:uncharacterized protein [Cicer arietinum]|uniref:FK506-binding protein 4-like n=1 Tax=Cicer arietinum TaxID=3827 RepID=A0A1S2YHR6_CICAR|nr:FK506-binding protein 4-like [Cicer arietinum]
MGNCGSNPKTNEGTEPEPVPEEVNVGGATEETPNEDNKSLSTLLNENVEDAKKPEEVKDEPKEEEPKTEEVKVQEEKPKSEEAKIEA